MSDGVVAWMRITAIAAELAESRRVAHGDDPPVVSRRAVIAHEPPLIDDLRLVPMGNEGLEALALEGFGVDLDE
jgi:hypothetical protein